MSDTANPLRLSIRPHRAGEPQDRYHVVDDGGETVVFVQGRCAVMIAEAAVRFIEEHGRAGLVSGGLERIEAWRSALEGAASSIRGEG